jgi:hypothetical protein
MNRKVILTDMKNSIGAQAPIVYFEKMTELLSGLFDHIEKLETSLNRVKTHTALAIQWEPRVAADMLAKEIERLRQTDKDAFQVEIELLKRAYAEDLVTQEYASFCQFWQDIFGWHPFLDYAE